jgi:hypothetical protein
MAVLADQVAAQDTGVAEMSVAQVQQAREVTAVILHLPEVAAVEVLVLLALTEVEVLAVQAALVLHPHIQAHQ